MKKLWLVVIGMVVVVFSNGVNAQREKAPQFKAVGNSEVAASLVVNGQKQDLRGRSSFGLHADSESLEKGQIYVGDYNLVFFDVPQDDLNYGGFGKNTKGNLSFISDHKQSLRYDAKSATLSGKIRGFVGADYMGAFAEAGKDSDKFDHTIAPRQAATLEVAITLGRPLVMKAGEKSTLDLAQADMRIVAETDQRISALPIAIATSPMYELEYIIAFQIEIAKRLCVQPVRFSRLVWNWPMLSFQYTGVGLGFGQPESNSQWAKADVVFTWRDWKTIYNPGLFFFSPSEASAVQATVNDADCVEVFFVEGDNSMHSGWGGGASFNGGEAYTKIITSDGNVDAGVDFVHLAHELGHSMDLPHPTAGNSSSTNTLMCPSGWANDNPDRNSQENKDNLSNPLFTFALKVLTAGPDCSNSADCGACPPIP